jgi:hypothetical protein
MPRACGPHLDIGLPGRGSRSGQPGCRAMDTSQLVHDTRFVNPNTLPGVPPRLASPCMHTTFCSDWPPWGSMPRTVRTVRGCHVAPTRTCQPDDCWAWGAVWSTRPSPPPGGSRAASSRGRPSGVAARGAGVVCARPDPDRGRARRDLRRPWRDGPGGWSSLHVWLAHRSGAAACRLEALDPPPE